MKSQVIKSILINGVVYKVIINKKAFQRGTYIRFINNEFHVSTSLLTSVSEIDNFIDKYAIKMIQRTPKKIYFTPLGVYIFGNLRLIDNDNYLTLLDNKIYFTNKDEFYEKAQKITHSYFLSRLRYYEKLMNIPFEYKLTLKQSKTLYGCNHKKTKMISLNIILIHYSEEIIDSVIVHELAHYYHMNHQKEFYNCIYSFLPDYDKLDKKLKKGILK